MESVLNCCRLRSPSINSSPATPLLLFHSSSFSSPLSKKTPFSGSGFCSRSSAFHRLPHKPYKGFRIRSGSLTVEEEERKQGKKKGNMTITPAVRIAERKLIVKDRTILSGVPDNVIPTAGSSSGPVEGIFVGAEFPASSCRQVVSLGTLRDVRFLSCFRFKLWWMAQKMGDQGRDIPLETQFLLLETRDGSYLDEDNENPIIYTVFLPLYEGPFRACLQGNSQDELELCIESGDSETKASSFSHSLFISAGTDPFTTISNAISAVKSHLKSFRQRHEKKLPSIADYFGWCTWDAFYQEVTQEGVEAGLQSLTAGGTPPKFIIIDDGWQSVGSDPQPEKADGEPEAEQKPLLRLTNIKENEKFKIKGDPVIGIKNIVDIAKKQHGLKYVYVWHAITGYWGGVRPGMEGMEQYNSKMQYPIISPGVAENCPDMKTDALTLQGLGLVDPKNIYRFYNELHSYLASAGVDGVKVDVQCILETLGAGLGGRIQLTRQYHQALDASVARNFPDNGCIACMSHNTESLYCSKQTAVVRASDDFFPRDPESHTIHIAAVAYNSTFLGEIMLPDWDMFHSLHPAAEYHASARAISGGPIYVSDAPGRHNFELLKKIVLPDGSILRARLPGRPTRDCLFTDPARDGVSLLKIWNMNKYTGVLGVYNCQGAAWSAVEKRPMFHHTKAEVLSGAVRARDVHHLAEAATDPDWNGDCVVYRHKDGELVCLPTNAVLPLSLKILENEIFTVSPIKVLAPGFKFAPVGLIDMYNAGGAIQGLRYQVGDWSSISELDLGGTGEANLLSAQPLENKSSEAVGTIFMEVKGCGRFGAYSSAKPRKCLLESDPIEFSYDSSCGLLVIHLVSMPDSEKKLHSIMVEV